MKRRNLLIITALLICTTAVCLLAAEEGADFEKRPLQAADDSTGSGNGFAGELTTIIVALAVVLAAIYLVLRVLRRFFPSLAPTGSPVAPVRLLARFPLAPRQTLHLVRCGSRLLLLGATTASINHLITIDDDEEIGQILRDLGRAEAPLRSVGKSAGPAKEQE